MTSVNGVVTFAVSRRCRSAASASPGFGRIHGDDGLREFTRAKAITRQRFALPVALTSFDRPEKVTGQLVKMVKLLHGRG
jgi:aldehyde dehydrogenase (NAD+)